MGAGHHEKKPGVIIQDGVDVHLPSHAGDPKLVNVRLPEGVHVTALESLERRGFLDGPNR